MVNGKKVIALCTARLYDSQTFGFVRKLNETLRAENCALLIFAINSGIYWDENLTPAETYVFKIIPYDELDCIIIMDEKIKSHKVSNYIINKAKETSTPVVVVDGNYEDTVTVGFDYSRGFEMIARHVIEHHHVKRPHMMAGLKDNFFSDQRIEIFKNIIKENGIAFDESMVSYGEFWADPTKEAMKEILKRDVIPDAIICANDIMAINVSDMLQRAGYKVPGDVLVSGFDGFEEVFFSVPKIATASCDTVLLADTAGNIALKMIQKEEVSDVYILPQLIPNESCGCAEHGWDFKNQVATFNNGFYHHQDDMKILYDVSTNMETSKDLWDMASNIYCVKTENSLTIVDRNVFDSKNNYFITEHSKMRKPDFHLLYDADYAETHLDTREPLLEELFYDETVNEKADVLSGNYRERIIELMDSGYPIIFNVLDYMNRPFGYNCYHYTDYEITDYSRTATVTNGISRGIGGFINLQYQKKLLEKLDNMYSHDALTGLYNRIGFLKVYEETCMKEENQCKPVTVIMSDLDGLKYINDKYGHADGDKSIVAVAKAMKEACPKHALSARYGGDEIFSVIFGECDADAIIEKIDELLIEYNKKVKLPYSVNSSSGAYTTVFDSEFELKQALRFADEKMYSVKNNKHYTGLKVKQE